MAWRQAAAAGLGALALIASPVPAAAISPDLRAAIPPGGVLAFDVTRDGAPLGTHTLRFETGGEGVETRISIRFEVRAAFLTLYSYRHDNTVRWSRDGLEGFAARTVENGEETTASLRRIDEGYRIEATQGGETVPPPLVPSTYWHPATRGGGTIVNTETGETGAFTATFLGREAVEVGGEPVMADRYRLAGAVEKDIWYAQGRWVKSVFDIGGSRIAYNLVQGANGLEAQQGE